MPLLKKKRFPLVDPPPLDLKHKSNPVWYSPLTHEIFDNYSQYLERTALYKKDVWQCEFTGQSNLTYAKALESERLQSETVQNKLPQELQKAILERAQFQTVRLLDVVDNVYNHFSNRFVQDEQVDCKWDDNVFYSAIVLEAPPLEDQVSDDVEYKIQLLDQDFVGLDDFTRNVHRIDLKRDRVTFSKSLLKKFIRDSTTKESYLGAPWIVKDQLAERFHINTNLPQHLESAKILAYSKSRKLQSLVPAEKRQELREMQSSAIPNLSVTITAKSRMEEAKKFEAALKYPMEDLDLPMYRRNPPSESSSVFLDMSPGSGNELKTVPNPTGDWPLRPTPSHETVPADCFGSFLMVWNFLSVFSRPLRLSPFSLNDFEMALSCSSLDQNNNLIYEVIATLLNCIIQHRLKTGYQRSTVPLTSIITAPTGYIHTPLLATYQAPNQSLQSTDAHPSDSSNTSDNEQGGTDDVITDQKGNFSGNQANIKPEIKSAAATSHQQKEYDTHGSIERGCGGTEVINIGKEWDAKPLPTGNNRQGWINILIGCINDLAIESNEDMDTFDRILCCLVPRLKSTLKEREQAFLRLDLKDKLIILKSLINVANESTGIKDYMEECQEQLTELRKHKIEANRDRKRILAERNELEKRFEDVSTDDPGSEVSETGGDSDNEENIERIQKEGHLSKHNSRQAIIKRRQMEQEEREAKRKKLYHEQRKVAKEKNQELRIRNIARKKLEKEECQVQKKLDQVDKDMRKYSTLRLKPLGRDRFYNRYYYLDNIGGGCAHGSGKLFVQSPSPADLAMVLAENTKDVNKTASSKNTVASLCGHGGGLSFICQLMEHQGLPDKAALLKKEIDRMVGTDPLEWWESFDDPKKVDDLLEWLNPKGMREYILKRELQKHLPGLLTGMKKTQMERQAEESSRNTRSKAATPSSWQLYINKLAK